MKKQKRVSLSLKMNLLIIFIILLVSVGLVGISYHVHSQKIASFYYAQAEHAAQAAKDMIIHEFVEHLKEEITSEEFQKIRAEALAANDEEIIRNWMLSRPSCLDTRQSETFVTDIIMYGGNAEDISLYSEYESLIGNLEDTIALFDINYAYIGVFSEDRLIIIADPSEPLFSIGTPAQEQDDFKQYYDDKFVPSTIYYMKEYGWLCSSYIVLDEINEGQKLGFVGVDIEMDDIVRSQQKFLVNSAVYVILFTTAATLVSIYLMNLTTVKPLQQLAQATKGFADDDDELTRNDVIQLPIRSNDEIGDLYEQIRAMQTRIIDYTGHITQITAERERAGTELRMAENIQRSQLPDTFPAFPNRTEFDLYASMTPTREVGGDFYDFFLLDDNHLALVIADVSDKGVPAALFMMSSKMLINYRAHQGGTPAEILTEVNAQICKNNRSKMFVTVWMGILDLTTGVMKCTNAGHEYPVLRGSDGVFRIFRDKHKLVIGGLPHTKYEDYELKLEPGDAIFVYTDGVPEANNAAGEQYGMERMEKALNRSPLESPERILEQVRADVDSFADGTKQFDDLTMLCLEYKGNNRR